MEDLLDIKSRKEQSIKDLEKLKAQIAKSKTFMGSTSEINNIEKEQSYRAKYFNEKEIYLEREHQNCSLNVLQRKESPIHTYRDPESPFITNKHLPDLVNHEKFIHKRKNSESQVRNEKLQNPEISKEYMGGQIQDPQQQRIAERFPYLDSEAISTHYSQLSSSVTERSNPLRRSQLPLQDTRQHIPVIESRTEEDNIRKDISQEKLYFGSARDFGQYNIERPYQVKNQSVSLTKVLSTPDKE